jgi:hypothetical protein
MDLMDLMDLILLHALSHHGHGIDVAGRAHEGRKFGER